MVIRSRFSAQTPLLAVREQRILLSAELRAASGAGDQPRKLTGYAAVFNQPSEVLSDWWAGRFVEFIAEGAFRNTLAADADVRALLNHDPNWVIGRTKAGTLKLWEDQRGLGFEVTPPNTQWARDLVNQVARGDITQASFGFQTVRDRWALGKLDGEEIDERWLLEVKLFDISPATFPAYPQTNVAAEGGESSRSLEDVEERLFQRVLQRISALPQPSQGVGSPPSVPPAETGHGDDEARLRIREASYRTVSLRGER